MKTKIVSIVLFLIVGSFAKPKAKSNPDADPEAWDWQNEPHNLPVFSPYSSEIKLHLQEQPKFLKINRNISVTLGETAYLPCRVKNLDVYTVSWIRASDVKVLSVGHLAFSSDTRIGVVQVDRPLLSATDWNLSIVNSSLADDGMYECQVNTEPKINYKVFLTVQDPSNILQKDSPHHYDIQVSKKGDDYEKTHSIVKKHHISKIEKEGFSMYLHDNGCICPKPEIVTRDKTVNTKADIDTETETEIQIKGGYIHYLRSGENLSLECTVNGHVESTESLHWTRGKHVMSPRHRMGVSLNIIRDLEFSKIDLFISNVSLSDTGNYTCYNKHQSSTALVVVTGSGYSYPQFFSKGSNMVVLNFNMTILLVFLCHTLFTFFH